MSALLPPGRVRLPEASAEPGAIEKSVLSGGAEEEVLGCDM